MRARTGGGIRAVSAVEAEERRECSVVRNSH